MLEIPEGELSLIIDQRDISEDLVSFVVDRAKPDPRDASILPARYGQRTETMRIQLEAHRSATWVSDLWDHRRRDVTLVVTTPLHHPWWRRARNALARLIWPNHAPLPENLTVSVPMLNMAVRRIEYAPNVVHVDLDNYEADHR